MRPARLDNRNDCKETFTIAIRSAEGVSLSRVRSFPPSLLEALPYTLREKLAKNGVHERSPSSVRQRIRGRLHRLLLYITQFS